MDAESPRPSSITAITPVLYSGDSGSIPEEASECQWCRCKTTNPKFCSLKCSVAYQNATRAWPIKYCKLCKKPFDARGNKKVKLYCSQSCAAKVNNVLAPKRRPKLSRSCLYCKTTLKHSQKVFCSQRCQRQLQYENNIKRWLSGEITGLNAGGTVSSFVKKWLRERDHDQCVLCGWHATNPKTNKVPVVADHIDGIWQNNRPENLRLLCPNCDSLQPTYKALNKGNGRTERL